MFTSITTVRVVELIPINAGSSKPTISQWEKKLLKTVANKKTVQIPELQARLVEGMNYMLKIMKRDSADKVNSHILVPSDGREM